MDVLIQFISGCLIPGLVVLLYGRKKATMPLAVAGMLLCGLIEACLNAYMAILAGVVCLIIMHQMSSSEIQKADEDLKKAQRDIKSCCIKGYEHFHDWFTGRGRQPDITRERAEGRTDGRTSPRAKARADRPAILVKKCPACGATVEISEPVSYCEYCESPIPLTKEDLDFLTAAAKASRASSGSFESSRQFESSTQSESGGDHSAYSAAPSPQRTVDPNVSPRSRTVALLLCFFMGTLGIHRFYAGRIVSGILYIFTLGGLGIGVLIDLIRIACGSFKDKDGLPIRTW